MFILQTVSDNVRVPPTEFHLPKSESLINQLDKKYANKVIHACGLCICVFDILTCEEGIVFACQDGAYQTKVTFRAILFKPFIGEILVCRIQSQSVHGIKLTMDFFDDIFVKKSWTKPGFHFTDGNWVWSVKAEVDEDRTIGEDEQVEQHDLLLEKGNIMRVRVENITFVDVGPVRETIAGVETNPVDTKSAPMTVNCSIAEDGLGVLDWWTSDE